MAGQTLKVSQHGQRIVHIAAGTQGLLVCGLHGVSSRLRELHPLLLIAAELRALLVDCKAHVSALSRALVLARKTFVKLFALFPGGTGADPQARFESLKVALRSDLQVRES
jgi:hypothetical protein